MMPCPPPRWSSDELDAGRLEAIRLFREDRMQEPLQDYLDAFDSYRSVVEDVLAATADLSNVGDQALEVLTAPERLEAVRYLAGPPISEADLKVLTDASLAPSRLHDDPETAQRIVATIMLGLDRRRFPWLAEEREATEAERHAAVTASAALIASRRVMTDRANEGKQAQEEDVAIVLRDHAGFEPVETRAIATLADAPGPGQFCRETLFGDRKADLVVTLWDKRVMPIECKVSNSSTNSVKRLNNDAAVKAGVWIDQFGTLGVVPTAVLSGVFKRHNLEQAQSRGLTLFWAHDLLGPFVAFLAATRR
jgi:hypothetical protein